MIDFLKFEEKNNLNFKDKELLKKAFTHRSYINENPSAGEHNERLEFLGDAVLELVITDYLFLKYPNKNEGDLTNYRSALVNADLLSKAAEKLGVNDFLLLSKGESKEAGRGRYYILADVYEAIVGAIYLDGGYEEAHKFIAETLFLYVEDVVNKNLWQDAKSLFQEKVQETKGVTPYYKVTKEEGPDHDKKFTCGVFLTDKLIAKGEGLSKQEAEQSAAKAGLKVLGWGK